MSALVCTRHDMLPAHAHNSRRLNLRVMNRNAARGNGTHNSQVGRYPSALRSPATCTSDCGAHRAPSQPTRAPRSDSMHTNDGIAKPTKDAHHPQAEQKHVGLPHDKTPTACATPWATPCLQPSRAQCTTTMARWTTEQPRPMFPRVAFLAYRIQAQKACRRQGGQCQRSPHDADEARNAKAICSE